MSLKVGLDAGHGMNNSGPGYDSGAVSGGYSEAALVLAMALTGRFILRREGIEVFLTRDDERDATPVSKRDDRAKAAGCHRFISLHLDWSSKPSVSGTMTLYRDAGDRGWAKFVHQAALEAFELPDRGIKTESASQHDRLAVLDFGPPACLVEFGFISCETDRERIRDRDRRVRFWEAIAAGLKGK